MNATARIPASAFALAALITVLPAAAWANTLSGMAIATGYYLIAVNFGIALVEAAILWLLFRLHFGRALGLMLAANLASAFAGYLFLMDPATAPYAWLPISPRIPSALAVIAAASAIAVAATLVIEYPFVHFAASKDNRSWKSSVLRCLAIHAVSIPLTAWWFAGLSNIGLATRTTIRASAAEFAKPPIGTVFFVRDGGLWSIRTDGTGERAVPVEDPRPIDPADLRWRALVDSDNPPRGKPFDAEIWRFGNEPARLAGPFRGWLPEPLAGASHPDSLEPGIWLSSHWRRDDRTGHLSAEGRLASFDWARIRIPPHGAEGDPVSLGMDAPGFSGFLREQAHLPSGQILFEVDGEIYLLDPETRELAFLARGRAAMSFFTPEDFAEGGVPEHAVGLHGEPIVLPGGGGAEETPP